MMTTPPRNPKRASAVVSLVIVLAALVFYGQYRLRPESLYGPAPEGPTSLDLPVYEMRRYRPPVDQTGEINRLTPLARQGKAGYDDFKALAHAFDLAQAYDAGRLFFKELTRDRPKDALAWVGFGMLHLKANAWDDARDAFQEALGLDPLLPEAHKGLADLGLFTKTYDEAIAEGEKALDLAKGRGQTSLEADIQGNLAQAFLFTKDYTRAKAYQDQAIARRRTQGDERELAKDFANLGRILFGLGQMEQGEVALQTAVKSAESAPDLFLCARIHALWAQLYQDLPNPEAFAREIEAGNEALRRLGADLPDARALLAGEE